MKHLFFVNSHTSFLSSVGTVNYLNLPIDDVIFFLARNYKNSLMTLPWKQVDISETFAKHSTHDIWRKKKIREDYQNGLDKLIDYYVSDTYKFYCAFYAHPGMQIFYTHPRCVEGFYVQEGGVPFKKAYVNKVPLFKKLYVWAVNTFYLKSERCHYPPVCYYPGFLNKQNEVHSFAISNTFFRYLPSINHIIQWPRQSVDINFAKKSAIFIFDGFVNNTYCELDIYLKNCKKLITEEAKNQNYVRFHPAQSEGEKKEILRFFKELQKQVEIMDESIPFEWVLLSTKEKLTVCGFGSSLLFFAKELGNDVVCKDEWLAESKKYQRYKKINGFLWFKDSFNEDPKKENISTLGRTGEG